MKIKILEYKVFRGEKVRVQSHNKKKGKWVVNPNFDFHKKVSRGETMMMHFVRDVKEYSKEIQ